MASSPNAFFVLGVTFDSSDEEVNAQFKKLALLIHPDKGGTAEEMHQLSNAKAPLLAK